MPGESVVLRARRHFVAMIQRSWKLSLLMVAALVVLILVHLNPSLSEVRWFFVLALALALMIYWDLRYIGWRAETFTITDQRVILQRGILRNFSRSIALTRIQEVKTAQGVLGRMLGYGDVEIESAGRDSAEVLHRVPHPNQFRNALFEVTHSQAGAPPAGF